MNRLNHKQALDFLNLRGNEVQGIHLGLHRTTAVMEALENPHRKYAVLHIAGTNGKGSVAAMSESILRHAGYRTGLYTSPHLIRVEERIRIAGSEILPGRLAALIARIRDTEARLLCGKRLDRPLTYFEFITCCAFLHFAEEKVVIAVIEVGLGGKLDATNVVQPDVSVITGVSHDHQNLLGTTLAAIAGEKAGILKPGVPAVTACAAPSALRVIRRIARAKGVPLLEIDRDCVIRVLGQSNGRFTIDLQTPRRHYARLRLSLTGPHQVRNAVSAVCAVEELVSFPVHAAAIGRGLANARWPGRLDEYAARRRTLLEGAHNTEGAQLLRQYLEGRGEKEIHLVFGAVRDKDIRKMGNLLFPIARSIHLTPVRNSRTVNPEEILALLRKFASRMRIHASSREALEAAWHGCPAEGLVVVTGSLYLVGECLPLVSPRRPVIRDRKRRKAVKAKA